jgi:PPOX class probable F420-dependent enzyme
VDYVVITTIEAPLRRELGRTTVGHFATTDGQQPSVVPVCFAVLGSTIYHAIDAKPKSGNPLALRRLRNLRSNPGAAFLIDHYEADWRRLWWVLVRGRVRLLDTGAEHRRAIAALKRKYPQYRQDLPLDDGALVIALDVQRLQHWRSSSPARPRGRRPDPPA